MDARSPGQSQPTVGGAAYAALVTATEELFAATDLLAAYPTEQTGEHGEVFTRRWVVETILDLAGYTVDRDLTTLRLVEPSCGSGAFLEVIAERLVASAIAHGRGLSDVETLSAAVTATDLLPEHVTSARACVVRTAVAGGMAEDDAEALAQAWVRQADYLLTDFEPSSADLVVGNPPYVRLEDMAPAVAAVYRRRWTTMGGRADLFIGFIERGLRSLKPGGVLGFICADRWMRNAYGKGLRELVAKRFSVDVVVSMHDVDAFEDAVSAYPAITMISAAEQGPAVVADTTADFGPSHAHEIVRYANDADAETVVVLPNSRPYTLARLPHWFEGGDSWPQGSPDRLAMVEHLSDHFPPLEDARTGTKVGIGVASGADKIFIVKGKVDIEDDRLLPMAMVRDLTTGTLDWSGHHLVNPWGVHGLVDLQDYPRLAAYYEEHSEALKRRYIAKNGRGWYATIDRVTPSLTARPKLYIPDMRMSIHPVLDVGTTYPHHNLYVVTSNAWDLRVLGGLLLSGVANAFVEAHCVKMRGGTLRFQAQYLRRIRVPRIEDVAEADAEALRVAFADRDTDAATAVALRLYGLDHLPE